MTSWIPDVQRNDTLWVRIFSVVSLRNVCPCLCTGICARLQCNWMCVRASSIHLHFPSIVRLPWFYDLTAEFYARLRHTFSWRVFLLYLQIFGDEPADSDPVPMSHEENIRLQGESQRDEEAPGVVNDVSTVSPAYSERCKYSQYRLQRTM